MLHGIIVLNPGSGFAHVEYKRGDEIVTSIVHVDQLVEAEQNVGKKVTFKLLEQPYGPNIKADNGVAQILTMDV